MCILSSIDNAGDMQDDSAGEVTSCRPLGIDNPLQSPRYTRIIRGRTSFAFDPRLTHWCARGLHLSAKIPLTLMFLSARHRPVKFGSCISRDELHIEKSAYVIDKKSPYAHIHAGAQGQRHAVTGARTRVDVDSLHLAKIDLDDDALMSVSDRFDPVLPHPALFGERPHHRERPSAQITT
jgi:hypothetical protein